MSLATWADKPLTSLESRADESERVHAPENDPGSSGADPTADAVPPPQFVAGTPEEEEVLRQIRNLPPELAVLLLSVGVLGFVLPGIIGTPAIIAGGLALWPKAFGHAETWFGRRFPVVHSKSLRQMGRFLGDLERRYPRLPMNTGRPGV
jgi:hypothetical protein